MGNSKSKEVSELEKCRTLSVFGKVVGLLKSAPLVDDTVAKGYFVHPSSSETWWTCLFVTCVLEMTLEDPDNADVYVRGIKRVLERRMDKKCFSYRVVDAYVAHMKELNDEPRPV